MMTFCPAAANIYSFLWSYINAGIYGTAHWIIHDVGVVLTRSRDRVKPQARPDSKAPLCDKLGVRMCW